MQHEEINQLIKTSGVDTNLISDGYHTFGELYEHRIALFIALCKTHSTGNGFGYPNPDQEVWRSKKHSDGSQFEGWFVLGLFFKQGSQIKYHLPVSMWDECAFALTREMAPQFDGHTSQDVLNRLKTL